MNRFRLVLPRKLGNSNYGNGTRTLTRTFHNSQLLHKDNSVVSTNDENPHDLGFNIPNFSKNIFTRTMKQPPITKESENNTSDLFKMSKEEILNLNGMKYKELITLPYDNLEGWENFCKNIVSITETSIVEDPRLIASLINNITNEHLRETIFSSLRRLLNDDDVKLSMVENLCDPKSDRYRELIMTNIQKILMLPRSELIVSQILFHYLERLSLLGLVNEIPLILSSYHYHKIMKITPKDKLHNFYTYMFNLNIITEDESLIQRLQHRLRTGSQLDQYILRTGKLNAKWHDTVKPITDDSHKRKMLVFFSFENLRLFTFQAIKGKDIVDSNLYLDLLVTKFESICNDIENSDFVIEDADVIVSKHVQILLRAIVFHIMTFKGGEHCIKMLNYMISNKLTLKFETILTIMKNLREQQYYEEALLFINNINLDDILISEKHDLVYEIFRLMKDRYPTSGKLIIGYAISMFKPQVSGQLLIEFFNDTKLLGIVYSDGKPGQIKKPQIPTAEVDKRLTNVSINHDSLCLIYDVVLSSKSKSDITPDVILTLFQTYMQKVTCKKYKFLRHNNIDDQFLILCLKHLLKKDITQKGAYGFILDKTNYDIAKIISTEFFKQLNLNRFRLSPYSFELLINVSLLVHNDYLFASQIMRIGQSYNIRYTFNQIYPFIIYHYNRDQFDKAQSWYNMLIKNGVTAKSPQMKQIYRIAAKLNWNVKGLVYRKHVIEKNHHKRKAFSDVERDHLDVIASNKNPDNTKDSNESITSPEIGFHDNLSVLLQHAKL